MSTATGQNAQQIQQAIQHELVTANNLLRAISDELKSIKDFTSPGGELDSTIKHNTSLISTLANLQHINLNEVPPMVRKHIEKFSTPGDQNAMQSVNDMEDSV